MLLTKFKYLLRYLIKWLYATQGEYHFSGVILSISNSTLSMKTHCRMCKYSDKLSMIFGIEYNGICDTAHIAITVPIQISMREERFGLQHTCSCPRTCCITATQLSWNKYVSIKYLAQVKRIRKTYVHSLWKWENKFCRFCILIDIICMTAANHRYRSSAAIFCVELFQIRWRCFLPQCFGQVWMWRLHITNEVHDGHSLFRKTLKLCWWSFHTFHSDDGLFLV